MRTRAARVDHGARAVVGRRAGDSLGWRATGVVIGGGRIAPATLSLLAHRAAHRPAHGRKLVTKRRQRSSAYEYGPGGATGTTWSIVGRCLLEKRPVQGLRPLSDVAVEVVVAGMDPTLPGGSHKQEKLVLASGSVWSMGYGAMCKAARRGSRSTRRSNASRLHTAISSAPARCSRHGRNSSRHWRARSRH